MKNLNLGVILIVCITSLSTSVYAEVAKRDAGGGAAKAQLLLRQIAADRDALQAENANLQQENEKLLKEIEKLKNHKKRMNSKINRADQAIDKYNEVNSKLRERINKDRERTVELIAKFKETVRMLKRVEKQRSELEVGLTTAKQEISACAENNVKLYNTNIELVELYQDKSVWDAIKQKEPVTQLGRVEIENIGQRYANKLQEFRYASNIIEE